MARKQSPLEDIIDIAAKQPWWLGVALAVAIYFLLGYFISRPPPIIEEYKNLDDMSPLIHHTLVRSIARAVQLILPLGLIIGAIFSAIKQYKNRRLYDAVIKPEDSITIHSLNWREFERLLDEAFRRQGYSVHDTDSGADGGVDLVLSKNSERTYVQCKQWKARRVGVGVVRELFGVVAANKVKHGIVVTSGEFTLAAREFAKKSGIQLIDGIELHKMLDLTDESGLAIEVSPVKARPQAAPSCPNCEKMMVRRKAARGSRAGTIFWGCPSFPKCRGTRSVD